MEHVGREAASLDVPSRERRGTRLLQRARSSERTDPGARTFKELNHPNYAAFRKKRARESAEPDQNTLFSRRLRSFFYFIDDPCVHQFAVRVESRSSRYSAFRLTG